MQGELSDYEERQEVEWERALRCINRAQKTGGPLKCLINGPSFRQVILRLVVPPAFRPKQLIQRLVTLQMKKSEVQYSFVYIKTTYKILKKLIRKQFQNHSANINIIS